MEAGNRQRQCSHHAIDVSTSRSRGLAVSRLYRRASRQVQLQTAVKSADCRQPGEHSDRLPKAYSIRIATHGSDRNLCLEIRPPGASSNMQAGIGGENIKPQLNEPAGKILIEAAHSRGGLFHLSTRLL